LPTGAPSGSYVANVHTRKEVLYPKKEDSSCSRERILPRVEVAISNA